MRSKRFITERFPPAVLAALRLLCLDIEESGWLEGRESRSFADGWQEGIVDVFEGNLHLFILRIG